MAAEPALAGPEDFAWASLNTPLSPPDLRAFCADVERLIRINPMLEIKRWEREAGGVQRVSVRNLSQVPALETELVFRVEDCPEGLRLSYESGLKQYTTLRIEPAPQGSKLTIVDDYGRLSEAQRRERVHEVDRSLLPWANDLQLFLVRWHRWSWLAPWRWYMRRVWQPMKPSARRITYMLLWITAAEFAFFLLAFAIYWLEFA